ncbi:16S RNA G1207 methylase RsmC [Pseudoclavibacter endophyticus]|uniref:Methyltransferase n=1 Tax=Pseudoclavibacter endophyticus TaxID=1778590 RepID=A0A6H9WMF5_9MICO|nr:methyltransferase [Pseudoclavibacter endophyticus]KAB1646930.1 methyltransferase [Pseudoclavibacter endophyticus]GGA74336.1 16S RNA G1207 methylase RsmC [Pseudoclavibacter endophyticus]
MTSEHYFSAIPASPDERRRIDVSLRGHRVEVETAPGTFSSERLDQGTRVLLDLAPAPPPEGAALDLGCGWGPIALALALESPGLDVWAVDVNERALDLATANAARTGATGIRASLPDAVPTDVTFNVIWSNPPIRVGKPVLHGLMRTWLPRLAPGGEAYLVVQKHLGADSLQRWLADEFDHSGESPGLDVSRYDSAKNFRILRVARPM